MGRHRRGKVYRSTTGKDDWSLSLQRYVGPVSGIVSSGSSLYAGFGYRVDMGLWDCWGINCVSPSTLGGLYRSTDGGATWTALPLKAVTALHVYRDTLYAATLSGLYVSTNGNAWSPLRIGAAWSPSVYAVTGLKRLRSDLILMNRSVAQRFRIAGDSLIAVGASMASPLNLAVVGEIALVNTRSALFHAIALSTAWDSLAGPRFAWIGEDSANFLALPRDHLAAYYSGTPNGATWTPQPFAKWDSITGLCRHRGQLVAQGAKDPILRLQAAPDGEGQAWGPAAIGLYDFPASALAALGGKTWIGKGTNTSSPFVRADTGHAWLPDTSGTAGSRFDLLAASDTRIFASSFNKGFVREGQAWVSLFAMSAPIAGLTASGDWAAAFEEHTGTLAVCDTLHAAQACPVSTPPIPLQDPGFGAVPTPFFTYTPSRAERLAADGNMLVFARDSLYVSLDRGLAWRSRGAIPGLNPIVIKARGGKIYAAGAAGPDSSAKLPVVAVSADTGRTWSRLGGHLPGEGAPATLALRPGEVFAATDSGVFRWREGGSWERAGQGMPAGAAQSLAIDGNRLVAGLEPGSVWELQLEAVAVRPARSLRARSSAAAPTGIFREGTGIWRRADGRALTQGKASPR